MPTNDERRELARRVRSVIDGPVHIDRLVNALGLSYSQEKLLGFYISESSALRLANLIDPDTSSFYDADRRRWYESLCHTDGDDSPESLREVLEDIVWAVLTIDLGPNGNVCQGIDEGIVQTESLLDAWESEIRAVIEREGGEDAD